MDARNFDMGDGEPKPIKNLGFANGWGADPKEYADHVAKIKAGEVHEMGGEDLGRCRSSTICYTCGIKWSIDSSD